MKKGGPRLFLLRVRDESGHFQLKSPGGKDESVSRGPNN